jgi:hypothetical protein
MNIYIYILVPLPVPFHSFIDDSFLLNITAYHPPLINLISTYEFQLLIHDKNNDNIVYERAKISNLMPSLGINLTYRLIPNVKHTIIFKHILNSIGYGQSNETIFRSI